jgi:SAM-dependent methyltransferase
LVVLTRRIVPRERAADNRPAAIARVVAAPPQGIGSRRMTLPDLSRLASSPKGALRAFGEKLSAQGLSLAAARPILAAARAVSLPLARPVRAFHLRRRRDPAGFLMRMFLFGDPVSEAEAKAALGDMTAWLLEVGLLAKLPGGGVVSPFVLSIADDLFILSDDLARGAEAVMGFGESTIELSAAVYPRTSLGRVLDLGCGSGTVGLVVSRRSSETVGTDINPRAIALSRVNAAINGIEAIAFREGSLFAPVTGELFDRIVSQPPFVPQPEGVGDAQFLYGGRRGDELALALLAGIPAHLAPGGRALVLVEWPDDGSEPVAQRIRRALGVRDANVLLLEMPEVNLDAHAATYAAGLHPGLGPAFEAEALVRREHFEKMRIRALVPALVVIERTPGGAPGWTHAIGIEGLGRASLTSERIDRIMAARAVARDRARLLATKLRVPEGTVFAQEQVGPGAEVPSTLAARFAPAALLPRVDLTLELLGLLTAVHEAESVQAGLARFAADMDQPEDEVLARSLPQIEQALLHGLLEPAGA